MFESFEHTADLGYRLENESLEGLFFDGAAALYDAALQGESGTFPVGQRTIGLQAHDLVDLFHDWLAELLFLLETESVTLGRCEFRFVSPRELDADVSLCVVPAESERTEIKAVTYHELTVQRQGDKWTASVVFDV